MEIKEQLKEHRARLGLSQEELADRIFVSRQTISNWETDRTYPDVQSLLLMSDLFGTSIDELVKGDVATMEKTIENEWKTMSRLAMTAWVLVGVGIACVIAGMALPSGPSSLASGFSEGEVLGIVLFVALWIAGLVLLGIVEHMKKKVRLGNLPRHPRLFPRRRAPARRCGLRAAPPRDDGLGQGHRERDCRLCCGGGTLSHFPWVGNAGRFGKYNQVNQPLTGQ